MAESICWTCSKALPNRGCSWSDKFIPIEGWDAFPTIKKSRNAKPVHCWHVEKCPLYERDKPKTKSQKFTYK